MKVVIAEPISEKLNVLIKQNQKDWVTYDTAPKSKEELVKRIQDADIACSYSFKFDADILSHCGHLQHLVIPAVGASAYVDMNYASQRAITVQNCPGYNSQAVAEMAVGLIIDVLRKITQQHNNIADGIWHHAPTGARLLQGKTVGLIGHGNVGKTIEKLLSGWAGKINYVDSGSTDLDVDSLCREVDILVVCCPATERTIGLLNASRIAMMKESAVLINVARGVIVDEDTLYAALNNNQILGAGLDVFVEEPQPTDQISESILRFTKLENVVCTSHTAGSSLESNDNLGQMLFDAIESCLTGSLINIYK